jgi:hypothetical protein
MMGGLLQASRENYAGKDVLEGFLADLREKSLAPLTRTGLQNEWLMGKE